MDELKKEEAVAVPTSETPGQAPEPTAPEQDPLKGELDRVQQAGGKTELEKAQYTLRKTAERIAALGGDASSVLVKPKENEPSNEDEKPLTRADLKEILATNANKTAQQLADEIPDNTERELVKYHIENSIRPSGDAQEDLRTARRIVNSIKNERIVEEVARKTPPQTHSSASGAPPIRTANPQELTPVEMNFMKPPFNMTREQIIKARPN